MYRGFALSGKLHYRYIVSQASAMLVINEVFSNCYAAVWIASFFCSPVWPGSICISLVVFRGLAWGSSSSSLSPTVHKANYFVKFHVKLHVVAMSKLSSDLRKNRFILRYFVLLESSREDITIIRGDVLKLARNNCSLAKKLVDDFLRSWYKVMFYTVFITSYYIILYYINIYIYILKRWTLYDSNYK